MFSVARGAIVAGCLSAACSSVTEPPSLAGPPPTGSVVMTFQAPKGVTLWTAGADPEPLCPAPCTARLEPTQRLEARVDELPDSAAFEVPRSAYGAFVHVEPAPRVLLALAAVTGTVGVGAMAIGGALAVADATGNDDLEGVALPAGLTIVAGGGVLAAGIVLAALSGTNVKIREALREPGTIRF